MALQSRPNTTPRLEFPSQVAVSLGDRCQIAQQLKTHGLRVAFFPFDYVFTPFETLYRLLETDFAGFLDPQYLITGITPIFGPYVEDTQTGVQFYHDFPRYEMFDVALERVRARYATRIARFRELLSSGASITFLRYGLNRVEAQRLHALLQTRYPSLDYHLVVLDGDTDANRDWHLDRTKNFFLPDVDIWPGHYDAWRALFRAVGLATVDRVRLAEAVSSTARLYCESPHRVLNRGVSHYMSVIVQNTDSSEPWPEEEPADIWISYHWSMLDGATVEPFPQRRFPLQTQQPGQRLWAIVQVQPPAAPGRYRLHWDLFLDTQGPAVVGPVEDILEVRIK